MKVFWCFFRSQFNEWGSYVVAESRGKAKAIFHGSYNEEGDWNDVRCWKIKDVPDGVRVGPRCLDVPDDPILKKLGLKYREEED